jgi:hypothetical protein
MIGQLLPNTNEMLQCILAIQILDLNTASASFFLLHPHTRPRPRPAPPFGSRTMWRSARRRRPRAPRDAGHEFPRGDPTVHGALARAERTARIASRGGVTAATGSRGAGRFGPSQPQIIHESVTFWVLRKGPCWRLDLRVATVEGLWL